MKCSIPSKSIIGRWKKHDRSGSGALLDWYFCEPKSDELPLRNITRMDKKEPQYEDGTFNACSSCNQRYLKKAVKDKEQYVFFFTRYRGQNKVLKKRFDKKYCITGYYKIDKIAPVEWKNRKKGIAISTSSKPRFFSIKDSYPLERLQKKSITNARHAKKHFDEKETAKILKHFKGKKNKVSNYIKETRRLYS